MTDLHARFRTLDELRPPDLWTEIQTRPAIARLAPFSIHPAALIAAAVIVIATLWLVVSIRSGGVGAPVRSIQPAPSASSGSATPTPIQMSAPAWTSVRPMIGARQGHTATLLRDGRVLVAGGLSGTHELASAELYDPRTGSWTETGSMVEGRGLHEATLLRDGTVLVTGGVSYAGGPQAEEELSSAELYDPSTGSWSAVGRLAQARTGGPATLLPDGRVLVAGGWGSGQGFGPKLASAELYDPATRAWTMTGAMSQLRHGHTATLLPNGTVLVAGGGNDTGRLASAELYDPAAGIWTMTGSLPEPFGGDATLLPDGTVLIAGGDVPRGPGAVASAHAAVYDPATGTWAATASMGTPRLSLASVMLPDGRVLVTGGRMNGGLASERLSSAELYDPVSGTWTATKDMSVARSGHTATLLPDGHVLVAGGGTQRIGGDADGTYGNSLASAEVYDPGR